MPCRATAVTIALCTVPGSRLINVRQQYHRCVVAHGDAPCDAPNKHPNITPGDFICPERVAGIIDEDQSRVLNLIA
ncbi:hypothetical protein D3C76_1367040 [compost metagenome]